MKWRMGLIIFVLIVAALFMAENALAQTKCKTVEVHMSDYWEYAGIDACGEAGWCGEGRLNRDAQWVVLWIWPGLGYRVPLFRRQSCLERTVHF